MLNGHPLARRFTEPLSIELRHMLAKRRSPHSGHSSILVGANQSVRRVLGGDAHCSLPVRCRQCGSSQRILIFSIGWFP